MSFYRSAGIRSVSNVTLITPSYRWCVANANVRIIAHVFDPIPYRKMQTNLFALNAAI